MAMGSKEFKQHQAKLGIAEPKTMYEVYAFSLQIKPVRVVKETSKFVWIDVGLSGMGRGGDGKPRKAAKRDALTAVCGSKRECKDWLIDFHRNSVAAMVGALKEGKSLLAKARSLKP